MEKKKLKKLVLKKERIVNLNDYQMNSLIGGSSYACLYGSVTIRTGIATYTQDVSLDACAPSDEPNCMTGISDYIDYDEEACQLPEIIIRP